MRISTTERQLFKRCRRKWNYASYNRMALSPVVNAPALDLGTIIHQVLADWTADETLDPKQHYSDVAQAYLQNIIQSYKERVGCAPSEAELQPTMDAMLLGQGMIINYKTKWHHPLPPGFTLIENELTLIQEVAGTLHCGNIGRTEPIGECNCSQLYGDSHGIEVITVCCTAVNNCVCNQLHELECTFDGVMADENGDLYIIERKTFSRTPSIEELNNNDQFLAYQWALSNKLPNVVGVAYDGLLKKLKPPAGKTMDDLFLRRILLRNNHEIEEFQQLLALELNDMANPNLAIYKTVPPVQGCQRWECSFMDICHAQSKGEPIDHLLKMFQVSTRKKHLDIVESTDE